MTQFLIIYCHRYEFTSYYNEEERHMNFIQCLHTVALETDSVSVLKRKKYVSTLRGSSYKEAIITGAARHSSAIWISPSCHQLLYLPCPAEQAEVRRVLGPDEGHWSVLHNGYCQQIKPPFIFEFLYVQNWEASVVFVKTRFGSWDGVSYYSLINPDWVRQVLDIPFFSVATSCSKSLPWNWHCQHVQF